MYMRMDRWVGRGWLAGWLARGMKDVGCKGTDEQMDGWMMTIWVDECTDAWRMDEWMEG